MRVWPDAWADERAFFAPAVRGEGQAPLCATTRAATPYSLGPWDVTGRKSTSALAEAMRATSEAQTVRLRDSLGGGASCSGLFLFPT